LKCSIAQWKLTWGVPELLLVKISFRLKSKKNQET
jgi:hypothetical protein